MEFRYTKKHTKSQKMSDEKVIRVITNTITNALHYRRDFLESMEKDENLQFIAYQNVETGEITGSVQYLGDSYTFNSSREKKEHKIIKGNMETKEMTVLQGKQSSNGRVIFKERKCVSTERMFTTYMYEKPQ